MKVTNCSALSSGSCRNGFPINAGCQCVEHAGKYWTPANTVPVCMDESKAGAMYPETGKPEIGVDHEPR